MILTAKFNVRRLPDRLKETWYPGVSGHSTTYMGQTLYEIDQTGTADISRDSAGGNGQALYELTFEHDPAVYTGVKLVNVDTLDGRIFRNCRLVSCDTQRISPRCVTYRYTWRQTEPGINW